MPLLVTRLVFNVSELPILSLELLPYPQMYRKKCKPLLPSYNDNRLIFKNVRLHVQFVIVNGEGTQQAKRGSCNDLYANLSAFYTV